jgi:hypothetical protein
MSMHELRTNIIFL